MPHRLPIAIAQWLQTILGCIPDIRPLAQSVNAEVYALRACGKPLVLKIYRPDCDTSRRFEEWCERLRLARNLPGIERFIDGRRFHDGACALFNWIPGQRASLTENPLTRPQLDALFHAVFPALDQAGWLNHDLNLGNVLTTATSANLVDLEYLAPIDPTPIQDFPHWINSDDWLCPVPSNKVSFEREGIAPYLDEMSAAPALASSAKAWFRDYLVASSPYHRQRAKWLQTMDSPDFARAIRYECARADALQAPSPALVDNEALRMQLYYDAFAHTLFVQWRGHPDASDYAGTHHAIRADADAYLAHADRLLASAPLAPAESLLLRMNRESAEAMRRILAGQDLPPTPAREAFASAAGDRTSSTQIARWLRAGGKPDAFVPADWAARLGSG